MMKHHSNEVDSYGGSFFRKQIKFLDSHNFIIRPLNLKHILFSEKVNILFQKSESQHLVKMLAFFCSTLKEKTIVTP